MAILKVIITMPEKKENKTNTLFISLWTQILGAREIANRAVTLSQFIIEI